MHCVIYFMMGCIYNIIFHWCVARPRLGYIVMFYILVFLTNKWSFMLIINKQDN